MDAVAQLTQEARELETRLTKIRAALKLLTEPGPSSKKRYVSPTTKKKMARAARKRWASRKKSAKTTKTAPTKAE